MRAVVGHFDHGDPHGLLPSDIIKITLLRHKIDNMKVVLQPSLQYFHIKELPRPSRN